MGASSIIINPIYILYSGYVLGPNPLFLGLHLKGVKQLGTGASICKGFPYHGNVFPYEKKMTPGAW